MAAAYVPRLCVGEGCGKDISDRYRSCRRCVECQDLYEKMRQADWRALHPRPAKPKPIKPVRYCLCGCGTDITHMRSDAVRARECQKRHKNSNQHPSRANQNEERKRTRSYVTIGPKHPAEPEYIPTIHCKECYGLPHRRPHMWRCPVCREEWQEEARPEQILARSSAGTVAKAGELYSYGLSRADVDLSGHMRGKKRSK